MFYLIQQTINDLKIHDKNGIHDKNVINDKNDFNKPKLSTAINGNNGINGNRDLEDFSGTQKNSGVTLLLSRVFFPFGVF